MKKNILAIIGSTRSNSSNLNLVKALAEKSIDIFNIELFDRIDTLPHFNPDLDNEHVANEVIEFRQKIKNADGLIICTPEYIFSLPGSLKNAIEWCVSTTVFSQKPIGLITASSSGQLGHKELLLVMKTVESKFTNETTLLISGIKGKLDKMGNLIDAETIEKLNNFIIAFDKLVNE